MILPIHPHPKSDEILSSWLVRLAFGNGFPIHTFYNSVLNYHGQIWTRDIDRHPVTDFISLVASSTGVSIGEIYKLTLASYEGRLFEELPVHGDAPWILAAGIYHRTRSRPGMQFCPRCLAEDDLPYYRKRWRTALAIFCDDHLCLLHDRCPMCHSPIAFHQHGIGRSKKIQKDAIRLCFRCGFVLSSIEGVSGNFDDRLLSGCNDLFNCSGLGSRYVALSGGSEILLLKGVRVLISVLSGRNGLLLRQVLSSSLNLKLNPEVGKDFEYQEVSFRSDAMQAIVWMLDEWPNRFVDVFKSSNFTRSRFSEDISEVPYWLASVVNDNLNCSLFVHSEEEIEAAIAHLRQSNPDVSWQSLSHLLDIGRDAAKIALHRWRLRQISL